MFGADDEDLVLPTDYLQHAQYFIIICNYSALCHRFTGAFSECGHEPEGSVNPALTTGYYPFILILCFCYLYFLHAQSTQ